MHLNLKGRLENSKTTREAVETKAEVSSGKSKPETTQILNPESIQVKAQTNLDLEQNGSQIIVEAADKSTSTTVKTMTPQEMLKTLASYEHIQKLCKEPLTEKMKLSTNPFVALSSFFFVIKMALISLVLIGLPMMPGFGL